MLSWVGELRTRTNLMLQQKGGTLGDQANSMLVSRETYVWGCGKTIEF